jgi:hypothetical protein
VAWWVVAPLADVSVDAFVPRLSGLEPHPVGVSVAPEGVTAASAPCHEAVSYRTITLTTTDGTVAWQAGATTLSQPVPRLIVGTAPPGFRDDVPLAGPLDPQASYRLEVTIMRPDNHAVTPLILAGVATFRPVDLRADRVWFDGRLATIGDFEREACGPLDA